jgi:hypothetical protein
MGACADSGNLNLHGSVAAKYTRRRNRLCVRLVQTGCSNEGRLSHKNVLIGSLTPLVSGCLQIWRIPDRVASNTTVVPRCAHCVRLTGIAAHSREVSDSACGGPASPQVRWGVRGCWTLLAEPCSTGLNLSVHPWCALKSGAVCTAQDRRLRPHQWTTVAAKSTRRTEASLHPRGPPL